MIKRTLREQIQELQRAEKRSRREILAADESTLPLEEDSIPHPREGKNQENVDPATLVEFQRGVTQKGGMCLWFNGYRYIRRVKNHFSCPFAGCRQTAIIDSEEEDGRLMGRIRGIEHNHSAEPSRKYAEAARQVMKLETESRGGRRLKAAKVLSVARVGLNDEAFFMVGSDEALARMMRREKAKVFSKVNLRNPLLIELPEELLIYEGQNMLLYDSRVHRPGQSDTLLDVLRLNLKFSVDGTFRAAPTPWEQLWVIGCFVNRRLVICVNCLLPGKRTCYYEEALRAVKQAIAPVEPIAVMSDFEKAELKSFELVFPLTRLSGCQFHRGQFLFKKWKDLGLFAQANEENQRAELMRRTFRDVLSLAYIPPEEVRRAFVLLVERAPIGCQPFLGYVARIFIGLTAHELEEGVDIAFAPRIDDTYGSSILSDHDYIQRVQQQQANVVPRWEHLIIRPPQFKISFWNVNHRALASIEKTNNAMEASHQQMARELNHHPALSDLLFALKSDIDKQCDIARAARSFNHVRRKQYVIRENRLMTTLARAEYVTNEDLLNVLTLIGLQIQGYVAGIRVRNLENAREEESTAEDLELTEENTGNDSQIYNV